MHKLDNFDDFVKNLIASGFSMGGGSSEGIYAIVDYGWQETPPASPIVWHTGNPETDPWEWRVRVLNERKGIAYSKCFFNKSGYITEEFYPCFLSLRRVGRDFEDDYTDGHISHYAKRIYNIIREYDELSLRDIKTLGGFGHNEKSRFDSALTELQMRMYLTICGARRQVNRKGEEYGWETTVFCTAERFWKDTDVFALAEKLNETDAYNIISERILELNPFADDKRIKKFIYGK